MAITPERLKELADKYGEIQHVKRGSRELVIRKPKRHEYKAFRAASHQPAMQGDAQENLIRQICVEPEGPEAIDKLFESWLAVAEVCTPELNLLVGLAEDESAK